MPPDDMSRACTSINPDRLPHVAVVIPYYQRERGILTRCVKSVLAQTGAFTISVHITDDASPIAADEELGALARDPRLRIHRQPNSGPAQARNSALERVDDADYIAFIDSDDAWHPDHLKTAVRALAEGACDVFFSNTRRYGRETSRFEWSSRSGAQLEPAAHPVLAEQPGLHSYAGDFFSFALQRTGIISTSALVYRYLHARGLRFDTSLHRGEDRLFKLKLVADNARVAFSSEVLCDEGRGINMFDTAGWGSDSSVETASDYINLSKKILCEFELTTEQRQRVQRRLDQTRREFVASLIHLIRRNTKIEWRPVWRHLASDPVLLARLPYYLLTILNARRAQRN